MDDNAAKREQQMEFSRREMQRKSLDTIRVFNPLEYTFKFKYDGYPQSVPAKSSKDFPRYLAVLFFKKISDEIIGQQIMAKGEELLKLREKQLGKSYLDKYEENREVWDKVPRLDDVELLAQIRDIVILGLVEEYGYDEVQEAPASIKPVDFRPMHDQLFSEMDKRIAEEPAKPLKPLIKKPSVEEINEK